MFLIIPVAPNMEGNCEIATQVSGCIIISSTILIFSSTLVTHSLISCPIKLLARIICEKRPINEVCGWAGAGGGGGGERVGECVNRDMYSCSYDQSETNVS